MPKSSNRRPSQKARKRRFHGNRFTSENEVLHASSSGKKFRQSGDCEVTVNPSHGYRIINFVHVFSAISALVKCKNCEKDMEFNAKGEQGLGFKINATCDCNSVEINSCPKVSNRSFEINRRLVFVMRLLGVGLQGINLFCGMMDFGQGMNSTTYYACLQNAWSASKATCDVILGRAAKEETTKNAEAGNEPSHLTVSGDGTWSKRGFSSLFGAITLIGKYSNKILDLVVNSKCCQACYQRNDKGSTDEYQSWYENHKEQCASNHDGSKKEVDGIIEMFRRSDEIHKVKYATYVGDDDTETFKSLLETHPYGEELIVKKLEKGSDGNTRNNESFKSVLWHLAPKHIFGTAKTIELAAFVSAIIFNEGFTPLLRLMEIMGITIGPQAKAAADARDDVRERTSKMERLSQIMEAQDEFFEDEEGGLYGPGVAD